MKELQKPAPETTTHHCYLCGSHPKRPSVSIGLRLHEQDKLAPQARDDNSPRKYLSVILLNGRCSHCQSCSQCGEEPGQRASIVLCGKKTYRFCESCSLKITGHHSLDAMIEASICSSDPEVIRSSVNNFAAANKIPLHKIAVTNLARELAPLTAHQQSAKQTQQ
jgi:hypothetical protein